MLCFSDDVILLLVLLPRGLPLQLHTLKFKRCFNNKELEGYCCRFNAILASQKHIPFKSINLKKTERVNWMDQSAYVNNT
jgi:hypothetical protein